MEDKKQRLLEELAKYEKKLRQLKTDSAEFKAGGSRYGDEYGEIQVKVYTTMIGEIKAELAKIKE